MWIILKVREPSREKILEEKVGLTKNPTFFNNSETG